MRILVVTAVAAERDALAPHADQVHVAAGVGPAQAAAITSAQLAAGRFDLVLCAGIGGGFAPLAAGAVAVASRIVFADLGAQTADGFSSAAELGFGATTYDIGPRLAVELADRVGGHLGTVLTVATVTGTAERAAELQGRYPDAVAEGMEGAGVAAAAAVHGVPVAEIRAISNAVGPRDRESWQIPTALAALRRAVADIGSGQ
jgi:futalosine hydrolase